MSDLQPAAIHPRKSPLRVWAVWGGGLAVLLGCFAYIAVIPEVRPARFDPYPANAMIAPLAVMAGYGITLPFACLWANRSHMDAIARFTWGRAISAFLFAGFFPLGLWGGMPTALGFFPAMMLGGAFSGETGFVGALSLVLGSQAIMLFATLLLYPLTSALIYGLRQRWRIPAFVATYLGPVGLLFLLGFRTSGQL